MLTSNDILLSDIYILRKHQLFWYPIAPSKCASGYLSSVVLEEWEEQAWAERRLLSHWLDPIPGAHATQMWIANSVTLSGSSGDCSGGYRTVPRGNGDWGDKSTFLIIFTWEGL